ncbi:hypothetical protein KY316_02965, partial [Candidatus Woesearchaeota archaeon]|nr:hypothetical protein [Candidatus Woesearchaeota archaeon]
KENNQPLDRESEGQHNVTAQASDGKIKTIMTLPVTVLKTNRAPSAVVKPATTFENQTVAVKLKGIDADNDAVWFNIANGPVGSYIINDTFYWTPPYETVSHQETIRLQDNSTIVKKIDLEKTRKIVYDVPVSIEVTDGDLSSIVNTTVKVIDVNRLPIVVELAPVQEFTTFNNNIINFTVVAVDLDGDDLSYTWVPETFQQIPDGPTHMRLVKNAGIKDMKVVVSDGDRAVSTSWKYAVNEQAIVQPVVQPAALSGTQTFVIEG